MDCLFCSIANGEIPSAKVYEDEYVYAFRDINPQAPVHVLVIPKKHYASIMECDGETAARLISAIQTIARQEGVDRDGFRVVSNVGENGRQSVKHLHFHILGGKVLSEHM